MPVDVLGERLRRRMALLRRLAKRAQRDRIEITAQASPQPVRSDGATAAHLGRLDHLGRPVAVR
jgi:hypothetical protein